MLVKIIMQEKVSGSNGYGKVTNEFTSNKPLSVVIEDKILQVYKGTGTKKTLIFGTLTHLVDHWLVIE